MRRSEAKGESTKGDIGRTTVRRGAARRSRVSTGSFPVYLTRPGAALDAVEAGRAVRVAAGRQRVRVQTDLAGGRGAAGKGGRLLRLPDGLTEQLESSAHGSGLLESCGSGRQQLGGGGGDGRAALFASLAPNARPADWLPLSTPSLRHRRSQARPKGSHALVDRLFDLCSGPLACKCLCRAEFPGSTPLSRHLRTELS